MKHPPRDTRLPTKPRAASRLSLALFACCLVLIQPLHSQTPSPQEKPQEKPMKHYALLFYTNANRTLSPHEQQQRQAEIAAWAKQVTAMGSSSTPEPSEKPPRTSPRRETKSSPATNQPTPPSATSSSSTPPAETRPSTSHACIPVCTTVPPSKYANGPTPASPRPGPDPQRNPSPARPTSIQATFVSTLSRS